ncbi:MAG TPA: hypothetical protein PLD88_03360, partial [Candidatus Berkiella sp.]|nr:hypothetical protein [Candidatus Berkiella sp.]
TPVAAMPLTEAPNLTTEIDLEEDALLEDIDDELVSEYDDEAASELEFADDSAAFFPEEDFFDEDSEDYAN